MINLRLIWAIDNNQIIITYIDPRLSKDNFIRLIEGFKNIKSFGFSLKLRLIFIRTKLY